MTDNTDNRAVLDLVERLVSKEIEPAAQQYDEREEFPGASIKALVTSGLMGIGIPEEYGGTGLDLATRLQVVEKLAGGCGATAFLYWNTCVAIHAINTFGNESQKKAYLPLFAQGKILGALAGTEAGGGSNPFSIQTTAKECDEGFVLNGNKVFITGLEGDGVIVILTRTDPEKGLQGFTTFLVDKDTPGLSFNKKEVKMGLRGVPIQEIVLDDCRVDASAALGQVGGGLMPVMLGTGAFGALGAGALSLGFAQAAVNRSVQYASERLILGSSLAAHPGLQARVAAMTTHLEAARALLRAAIEAARVPGPPVRSLQAKLFVTETALAVINDAIQMHGAYGYSREFPLERHYRDARALTIHFGVNEAVRENLGKMVLGLM